MIAAGELDGDIDQVSGLIWAGLKRLDSFRSREGMYALWSQGTPNNKITAKIAHRLLPFRELPFEGVADKLDVTKSRLLRSKVKDNQLLPLDDGFKDQLRSVRDAVSLYFAGNGEQAAALKLLHQEGVRDGEQIYWNGSPSIGYWGGKLEATCDAARVMLAAGDPLFRPAFNYIGSQLIDGRLFSTADTRALIELLQAINRPGQPPVVDVDGDVQQIDRPIRGTTIKAVEGNLLVRAIEEIEVNYLEPKSNYKHAVQLSAKKVKLGERITLEIGLKEETLCPVARIFLPGNLAFLTGGANAQTAYLPVNEYGRSPFSFRSSASLSLDAVAVRRGVGNLYVMVHDLYDPDKVGTAAPISVEVV